jgi:hypothetical protein
MKIQWNDMKRREEEWKGVTEESTGKPDRVGEYDISSGMAGYDCIKGWPFLPLHE